MLKYRIGYEYVFVPGDNTYPVSLPTYYDPAKSVLSQSFVYICPRTGELWAKAYCKRPIPTEWRARYACPNPPTSLFTPVEQRVPGFLETLPVLLLWHEFLSLKQELGL